MKKIVVFSGAGLSADSGIQTFRDSDGLWENHKVEDVSTPGGWKRDRKLVLDFYKARMESMTAAEPNAAHKALAKLDEKYDVWHITQNIDDLLERAGCRNVTHLHGSVNWRKCEQHPDCGTREMRTLPCDYRQQHFEPVKEGDLCPKCGHQMRPDVVWFEEPVNFPNKDVREWLRAVKYGDGVFMCVGTSAQVHPAASLIPLFAQVKKKYIVDKAPRRIGDYTLVAGNAAESLPPLVDKLLAEAE